MLVGAGPASECWSVIPPTMLPLRDPTPLVDLDDEVVPATRDEVRVERFADGGVTVTWPARLKEKPDWRGTKVSLAVVLCGGAVGFWAAGMPWRTILLYAGRAPALIAGLP